VVVVEEEEESVESDSIEAGRALEGERMERVAGELPVPAGETRALDGGVARGGEQIFTLLRASLSSSIPRLLGDGAVVITLSVEEALDEDATVVDEEDVSVG